MKKLEGKTAIVTGGASGIGKAAALAFAAEGANVVIATSRIVDKAEALAAEIKKEYGVGAIGLKCDVRSEQDVMAMVEAAVKEFGRIDIAFNNAGVGPDGVTIPLAPITEVEEKDWDWVVDVDLKGVFLCMKHELRVMQKQLSGCIINTASTAGLKPMGNFGGYGPAKAGMILLSKAAAVENRDKGIRINVVCPGPTRGTGMADRMFKDGAPPQAGTPEQIADVVLWLASEDSSHITGNVLLADGGLDIL